MNKLLKSGLLTLAFLPALLAYSQVNDAGLWMSVNLEKKLNQSLIINFSEELRLMENISEASTIFSDVGLDYRLTKKIKASLHYRFINDRRLDDSYESRNRLYFDLSYRQKIDFLALSVRERVQDEFAGPGTSDKNDPEYYSRTKASVKFDINLPVAPYLSAEFYLPLNDPEVKRIDKTRYSAGIEYSFAHRHMIDLNYMIQRSRHKVPENDYVIGLGYYYSF